MSKLKVYTFPDPVLAQKAKPIERVEKTYFKLADGMLEAMYDFPGIGLAANQVGVLDRIIVVDTEYNIKEMDELEPGEEIPQDGEVVNGRIVSGRKPKIMVNPEIIAASAETSEFLEGCLSRAGYTAMLPRALEIRVAWLDIGGGRHEDDFRGWPARIVQHEIDHLDGIFYTDRMIPRSLMAVSHFEKRFRTALIADIKAALGL